LKGRIENSAKVKSPKNIALAICILVILLMAIFYTNTNSIYEDKIQELKNQKQQEIEKYESELSELRRHQDSLISIVDSLNISGKTVLVERDKLSEELKKVKGRYQHHTPGELEIELMKRYNETR
jgi:peptidoglycan hydrolase CwlO-like protein